MPSRYLELLIELIVAADLDVLGTLTSDPATLNKLKERAQISRINGGGRNFDSVRDCQYAASLLFAEIRKRHGDDEARRIFSAFGPLSTAQKNDIENRAMLDVYDLLKWTLSRRDGRWVERWSNNKVAKVLTEWGYSKQGGANWGNLRQHIRRLRKRYGIPDKPPE